MSDRHQSYSASLLFAGPRGGEILDVLDVRVAYEPPVLERVQVKVSRAPVNNEHNSELGLSARHAATVALQLLFCELNHNDPVARLWFDIEPPSMVVTGRSAELLFGLVTYLRLGAHSLPAGIPNSDFMATGTLDPDGNVGSVEKIAVKVRAALASNPVKGAKLFYPRADEGQLDDALRIQCREQGLILCPVDRIDEALDNLGTPLLGSWPSGLSPFRSLEAFDASSSRAFFGRQQEVATMTALLGARAKTGRPGALIIGASGAGKSSFCLAGVLPALAKSQTKIEYAVWRPRDSVSALGDEPADERRLVESIAIQWQKRDANQPGFTLTRSTTDISQLDQLPECIALAEGLRQIFVVDQFEELFTLPFTQDAKIAFAKFLQAMQSRGVWIIGTLRSEFYPDYLELADEDGAPVLASLFEGDGQYNLPRMSREALSQVIICPAELAGLRFEQRPDDVSLAQALLADAMTTDDALPLLGFALQTLFDDAERPKAGDDHDSSYPRTLTFKTYDGLGRLSGAIGVVAARAYGALDADAQAELAGLLSAVAVPSMDSGRETARPAPIDQWPVGSAGRRLIDALTNIRVLVSERGATPSSPALVRVAHEALFSHWDEAAMLLAASRQNRLLIEVFRQRAEQWDADGRHRDALLTSPRDLENARAIDPIIPSVESYAPLRAFIGTSIVRAQRVRRTRFALAGMMALMLMGLTAWALNGQRVAARQSGIAQQQTKKAEIALAEAKKQRNAADIATRQAVAAGNRAKAAADAAEERRLETEKAREGEARQLALAQQRLAEVKAARKAEAQQLTLAEQRLTEANVARQGEAQQLRVALDQRSRSIIQLAELAIDRGDPMTGILLAQSQLKLRQQGDWAGAAESALLRGFRENREIAALIGHSRVVRSLAFSPDGRKLISASDDRTLRVWTLGKRNPTPLVLKGHTEAVASVAFSPDGERVISASNDSTARIWTFDGNNYSSFPLVGHEKAVFKAAFGPDARHAVTASYDCTVRSWTLDGDHPTSTVLYKSIYPQCSSFALSKSGDRLALITKDKNIQIWTLGDKQQVLTTLNGQKRDGFSESAFSPDGGRLATIGADGSTHIWTVEGSKARSIALTGPDSHISHFEFSPDGKRLLAILYDGTARVWSFDGNQTASILLDGHKRTLAGAHFSPDGKYVVTYSADGTARVWAIDTKRLTSIVLSGHQGSVTDATFSPDGRFVATASNDDSVRIWNIDAAGPETFVNDATLFGGEIEYSEDGKRSVITANGGVVVSNLGIKPTAVAILKQSDPELYASYSNISPDGRRIFVNAFQKSGKPTKYVAKIWTLDGERLSSVPLEGSNGYVSKAVFSRDNRALLTSSEDGMRLWLLGDGTPKSTIIGPPYISFTNAAFSPDGKFVVAPSNGNDATVWKLDEGQPTPIALKGHTGPVRSAIFSPDGKYIVTASADNSIRIWTLGPDGPKFTKLEGHRNWVGDVAFSPDGRHLVSTSGDWTARIWSLDGDLSKPIILEGHRAAVTYAQFSPDGGRILTQSNDGNIRIWTINRGQPTHVILAEDVGGNFGVRAKFGPDGQYVVITSNKESIRVLAVPFGEELMKQSDSILTRCMTGEQRERAGLAPDPYAERSTIYAPPCM